MKKNLTKIVLIAMMMHFGQVAHVNGQNLIPHQITYGSGTDRPVGGTTNFTVPTYVDGNRAFITASTSNSITITNNVGNPFKIGDIVLIIKMTDICTIGYPYSPFSNTQNWEFQTVASIGAGQTSLTFAQNLWNYAGFYNNHSQVIQVPQYKDVTFGPGAYLTCQPWSSSSGTGGVIPLLANGTLTFSGDNMNADYTGFPNNNPSGIAGTNGYAGGAGGLAGTSGSPNGLDGIDVTSGYAGEGIGGAGNGGHSNQQINFPLSPVAASWCGCIDGSGFATNESFVPSNYFIELGPSGLDGEGGAGGNGGGGAGGGAYCPIFNCPVAGDNGNGGPGGAGGNGGNGGAGGKGGGIILIQALYVDIDPLYSGFILESKGEDGADADNIPIIAGGQGGIADYLNTGSLNYGGGGGDGADGGNGGNGGDGGVGGTVYITTANYNNPKTDNNSVLHPALLASLSLSTTIKLYGGDGGAAGTFGAGGAAGLNANYNCLPNCPTP